MDETKPGAALIDWLLGAGLEISPPIAMSLITGGRSNLTFSITDGVSRPYVLRRPPLSDVLETAHNVGREFQIMSAVGACGIPVPVMRARCDDPTVIGAPFYVMDFVDGSVLAHDEDGGRVTEHVRSVASRDLVDVLCRIHSLDVDEIGLGDLSRRENYLPRQLARWSRQYAESSTRDIPLMGELHSRLVRTAPQQRFTGLVHGDYRFGNVMIDDAGEVLAVLDWELATLGDPLADLGWMLATWRQPGEPEIFESPTAHAGFLTRSEALARYEHTMGRDVGDINFYVAFSYWRLACISEGIFARYSAGAMGDGQQDGQVFGNLVYGLASAAMDTLIAS